MSSLSSPRTNFQTIAGSSRAGGDYVELTAGAVRELRLPAGWSVLARANGQYSAVPLINNEQFALGGTAGVRGYQEGANYTDAGWRVLFDLRAPPIHVGSFPTHGGAIPAFVRCSWFMDYGEGYSLARPALAETSIEQWGTGVGFYLTAGPHLDARLTFGWALANAPAASAGSAQAYFSVGYQF
jgi:hemolysin activation/secretion protein